VDLITRGARYTVRQAIDRRCAIADAVSLAEAVEKLAGLHAGQPAPATVRPTGAAKG
jgi:hypothetical protein